MYSSEEEAQMAARDVLGRIWSKDKENWRPRVWENLGWHWALECGALSLYPSLRTSSDTSRAVRYHAMVAPSSEECGVGYIGWYALTRSSDDPNEAVQKAAEVVDRHVTKLFTVAMHMRRLAPQAPEGTTPFDLGAEQWRKRHAPANAHVLSCFHEMMEEADPGDRAAYEALQKMFPGWDPDQCLAVAASVGAAARAASQEVPSRG